MGCSYLPNTTFRKRDLAEVLKGKLPHGKGGPVGTSSSHWGKSSLVYGVRNGEIRFKCIPLSYHGYSTSRNWCNDLHS
jgi:hypothetical protein